MGNYNSAKKKALEKFMESTGYGEEKLSLKPEGYVYDVRDNLLGHQRSYNDVAENFVAAQGNELHSKMCAVHSSSALAVNAFAYFIDNGKKKDLKIGDFYSIRNIQFERNDLKINDISKGFPPNFDLCLSTDTDDVFIESKFLEPLNTLSSEDRKIKKSYFNNEENKNIIKKIVDLDSEEVIPKKKYTHFDIAQMIKHYLAIENNSKELKKTTLIYLYWTPLNAKNLDIYEKHQEELTSFQEKCDELKSKTHITFKSMTYTKLFDEWAENPNLEYHVAKLRERYCFGI